MTDYIQGPQQGHFHHHLQLDPTGPISQSQHLWHACLASSRDSEPLSRAYKGKPKLNSPVPRVAQCSKGRAKQPCPDRIESSWRGVIRPKSNKPPMLCPKSKILNYIKAQMKAGEPTPLGFLAASSTWDLSRATYVYQGVHAYGSWQNYRCEFRRKF